MLRLEDEGGVLLVPFGWEPRAMVYAADVRRALGFYRDLLGFKLVDEISPRRYTRVCAAARA